MSSRYSVRREDGHASRALGGMASLRLAMSLCDVTLQADSQQFEAHRVVLAASSAYFRAMFAGNLEESRQRIVVLRFGFACGGLLYIPRSFPLEMFLVTFWAN